MDKKKALEVSRLLREIDDLEWKESWLRTSSIDEKQSLLLYLVTKELKQLNKQLEEL